MDIAKKLSIVLIVSLSLYATSAANTNVLTWSWYGSAYSATNVPQLATNVIALAGSDNHCVALLADRTVRAWGNNVGGNTNVPSGATDVVAIAAGSDNSLAATGDGQTLMWGRMASSLARPYVPPEATNVVALGVGRGALHSVALRADGTVVDWGYAAANVPSEAFNIVSVAAGSYHSLAVRSDGRVISWGMHANPVPASATNIVAVAAGEDTSLAVRADGTLLCWGGITTPDPAVTNVVDVAACGRASIPANGAVVLRRDGSVYGWGPKTISATNAMAIGGLTYGALAVKAAGPPIFPLPAVRRVVAAGQTAYLRLCAVGALPLAYQWSFQGTNLPGATRETLVVTNARPGIAGFYSLVASNALGMITNADMELAVVPLVIERQPTNRDVHVGANTTLTVGVIGESPSYQWQFNGTNITWGTSSSLTLTNIQLTNAGAYAVSVSNEYGSVVSSNVVVSVWQILVTQLPQDRVVFRGGATALSLGAQAGSPLSYQWQFYGTNLPGATDSALVFTNALYEQTGAYTVIASTTNAVVTNSATLSVVQVAAWGRNTLGQTNVLPDLTNVIALAAGGNHSLALRADGTVAAWRWDSSRTNVPMDLTNVAAISAGEWGSLALREDGSISAWGFNNRGQTNVPPELTNVLAVAAGGYHNLALKPDGTVVAWGQNNSGQTNVPSGLTEVVAVAARDEVSLALRANGRVTAWGYNGAGQTNVPADLSNVVAIAAGTVHCVALRSDGTVTVWGNTTSYGLASIPAAATNIVAVGAGYGHCVALRDDGAVIAWGYYYDGQTNVPTGLQQVTTVACGSHHAVALVGGMPHGAQILVASPTWNGNGFSVAVPSRSGRVYRLEYKDELADAAWKALPLVAGTGHTVSLRDRTSNGSRRFYRVRQW